MKTIISKVGAQAGEPLRKEDMEVIRQAGEIIQKGGLAAFPTETVYGLGADALQSRASEKIYEAKGRPSDNPLIIHIADMDALPGIVRSLPEQAELLAERFWPGPLTMILYKADCVPYETTGGLETAAVRMPDHPAALALIRAAGGYVAAPSANTSGRPSPTRAEHVAEDLGGKIDMILDGGAVGIGLESTIVDLTASVPTVLRPGAVTLEMLSEVIGSVQMDPGLGQENDSIRPKAPGMKYRHYAPKAELVVVEGAKRAVIDKIRELSKTFEREKVGIICADEHAEAYSWGLIKPVGAWTEEEAIARNLYNILREFDRSGVEKIYSESFDTPKMGQAIMNRLLKAAGQNRIQA